MHLGWWAAEAGAGPIPKQGDLGFLLLTDLGENRQRPQSGCKPKSEHTN